MTRLRYQLETSIRDVVLILHRAEVPSAIIEAARQRLAKLVGTCIEMDAEVKEAAKPDPDLFCRELVYEMVDITASAIAPQRQLERNEKWNYELRKELSKANADLEVARAEVTLHKTHLHHVRAAHQYTLQSYFREVHLLRKRNLAALGDESIHKINHEAIFDYRKYLRTLLDDGLDTQLNFVSLQETHQGALRNIDELNLQVTKLEADLSTVFSRADAAASAKVGAVVSTVKDFSSGFTTALSNTHVELAAIKSQVKEFHDESQTMVNNLSTALGSVTLSNKILVDFMTKVCEYIASLADGDYALARAMERRRQEENVKRQRAADELAVQKTRASIAKGTKILGGAVSAAAGTPTSKHGRKSTVVVGDGAGGGISGGKVDTALTTLEDISPSALANEYIDFTRKAFQTALQIDPSVDSDMVRKIKLMWRQSLVSSKAIEAVVGCRKISNKYVFAQEQISKIGAMLLDQSDPNFKGSARHYSLLSAFPMGHIDSRGHIGNSNSGDGSDRNGPDGGRNVVIPTKTFNVIFRDVTNVFRSNSTSLLDHRDSTSSIPGAGGSHIINKPVASLPEPPIPSKGGSDGPLSRNHSPATRKSTSAGGSDGTTPDSAISYAQALRFVIDNSGDELHHPPLTAKAPEGLITTPNRKKNSSPLSRLVLHLLFAFANDPCEESIPEGDIECIVLGKSSHQQLNNARIALALFRAAERKRGERVSKWCTEALTPSTVSTAAPRSIDIENYLIKSTEIRTDSEISSREKSHLLFLAINENAALIISKITKTTLMRALTTSHAKKYPVEVSNIVDGLFGNTLFKKKSSHKLAADGRTRVGTGFVTGGGSAVDSKSRFRKAVTTIKAASMFLKVTGMAPLSHGNNSFSGTMGEGPAADNTLCSTLRPDSILSPTSQGQYQQHDQSTDQAPPSEIPSDRPSSALSLSSSENVEVTKKKKKGLHAAEELPRGKLSPVRVNHNQPHEIRRPKTADNSGYSLVPATPYTSPTHLLNSRGRSPLHMSRHQVEFSERAAEYYEDGSPKEPPQFHSSPMRLSSASTTRPTTAAAVLDGGGRWSSMVMDPQMFFPGNTTHNFQRHSGGGAGSSPRGRRPPSGSGSLRGGASGCNNDGSGVHITAVHVASLRRQQQLLSDAIEGCILQDPRVRDLLFAFHAAAPSGGETAQLQGTITATSSETNDHSVSTSTSHLQQHVADGRKSCDYGSEGEEVPIHTVAASTADALIRHLEATFGCHIPLEDVVMKETNVLSLILDALLKHEQHQHQSVGGDVGITTNNSSQQHGKKAGIAAASVSSTKGPQVVNVHLENAAAINKNSTKGPKVHKGVVRLIPDISTSSHAHQYPHGNNNNTKAVASTSAIETQYDTDALRVQAMEYPKQITIPGRHTILNNPEMANRSFILLSMAALVKAGHALGSHGGAGGSVVDAGGGSGWSGYNLGGMDPGAHTYHLSSQSSATRTSIPTTGDSVIADAATYLPTVAVDGAKSSHPMEDISPPTDSSSAQRMIPTSTTVVQRGAFHASSRPGTAPAIANVSMLAAADPSLGVVGCKVPKPPTSARPLSSSLSTPSADTFSLVVSSRRRASAQGSSVSHDFTTGCAPISVGLATSSATRTTSATPPRTFAVPSSPGASWSSRPSSASASLQQEGGVQERPSTAATTLQGRPSGEEGSRAGGGMMHDKRSNPNYPTTKVSCLRSGSAARKKF